MLDKDTFVDVYLPYSEDVEHPEDGYAIRSAAHGIEVYHTIVHSEENARAVVEQAFEELTSSGVALYEDEKGIFETQYREERNFACKRVVYTEYTEDGGANARLTVFRADIKHGEYYLYTKITYYPEYMDEGHHALVEELGDALTLSLPQL